MVSPVFKIWLQYEQIVFRKKQNQLSSNHFSDRTYWMNTVSEQVCNERNKSMVSSAILIYLAICVLSLIAAHCGIASEFDQRGHLRTGICIKIVNRVNFDFWLFLTLRIQWFLSLLSFWEVRVCQLWRFWSHYCYTIKLALPLEYLYSSSLFHTPFTFYLSFWARPVPLPHPSS